VGILLQSQYTECHHWCHVAAQARLQGTSALQCNHSPYPSGGSAPSVFCTTLPAPQLHTDVCMRPTDAAGKEVGSRLTLAPVRLKWAPLIWCQHLSGAGTCTGAEVGLVVGVDGRLRWCQREVGRLLPLSCACSLWQCWQMCCLWYGVQHGPSGCGLSEYRLHLYVSITFSCPWPSCSGCAAAALQEFCSWGRGCQGGRSALSALTMARVNLVTVISPNKAMLD
jgi:hypothetical protein